MDIETKVFVGQKAFINRDGKVLVLKDPDYVKGNQKGLDFPGGRFRWGNDLMDELKREVAEETGLEVEIGTPFFTWTNQKLERHGEKFEIVLIGYLCEYKSGEVTLSDEHVDFEWVGKDDFKKWEDGTDYYKALEKYFEYRLKDD